MRKISQSFDRVLDRMLGQAKARAAKCGECWNVGDCLVCSNPITCQETIHCGPR
ncbi:hypothetical protein FB566_0175 [Stackebrandtia endophytica]|uniref:Uncharacterized protein n=1 Tax=Stackebrandtia endophytica TaxID=1496996 RepID=A0A543AQ55_9ACTN|nr:hypothetical protein [Stackebrandtia endophytica]TQL74689.1 hypothetical protein FB566_0175 [Stackebrandtia endophytica]